MKMIRQWQLGVLALGAVLIAATAILGMRLSIWTVLVIALLAICPLVMMVVMHGSGTEHHAGNPKEEPKPVPPRLPQGGRRV
jgi:Ca2+/Na+ antiporter